MAWIKIESSTPDKPELIAISSKLGIDQDAVLGKLCRLWIWADYQTYDGNAGGNGVRVTEAFVDRCTFATGFAQALVEVGWLRFHPDGHLEFVNFDLHNGETAKKRALTAKRQARFKSKSQDQALPGALPKALPEKIREEKSMNTHPYPPIGGKAAMAAKEIERLQPEPNAKNFQRQVADCLLSLGWRVDLEFEVPDRGDGRRGFVDIHAANNGEQLAIEVDRATPREKSIRKLESLADHVCLIVLRNPESPFGRVNGLEFAKRHKKKPEPRFTQNRRKPSEPVYDWMDPRAHPGERWKPETQCWTNEPLEKTP